MITSIIIWALTKLFNGKNRKELEPCIKELYRRMAQDNLKIRTEIVKVKKGTTRYDLMFFETPEGKIRLNLGRHWNNPLSPRVVKLEKDKAYLVEDNVEFINYS